MVRIALRPLDCPSSEILDCVPWAPRGAPRETNAMRKNGRIRSRAALVGIVFAMIGTAETAPAKVSASKSEGTRAPRDRSHVTYASWYGWDFAKRRTASGELFNPMALTAAHRTLPLGSKVRVTNLTNGRTVVLRITDRGPYHRGRGIDVSREAARRLKMVNQGVAKVRIDQLPAGGDTDPVPTAIAAWPSAIDGAR